MTCDKNKICGHIILWFSTARPIPKCNDGDLRLAAGYSLSDGVPQVCINGQWLSACYDSWSSQHSDGFCKLLLNRTDVGKDSNNLW